MAYGGGGLQSDNIWLERSREMKALAAAFKMWNSASTVGKLEKFEVGLVDYYALHKHFSLRQTQDHWLALSYRLQTLNATHTCSFPGFK